MSILKKYVYPICMASVLCACPITASAVELSDTEIGSVSATVNASSDTTTTTTEEPSTSSSSAQFSITNASRNVGENVDITITADADTAFASATFVLHYDSSKLKFVDYSIPSNSGLNNENLTRVEDKDSGVVYLVLAETEEDIKKANITMTFEILSAGDSQVSLEITDMFTTDGSEVSIPDVQATGTITGIEKETEPPVTTTAESSETETTTTTTTTTVSSTEDSAETTTTSSIEAETQGTTTAASENNDSQTTTQPSSTTLSSSRNNTTTSTTTTTKSTTTTTKSNNNNNGNVPTGDDFPVALLLSALGIAGVALVKSVPHQDKN